MLEATGALLEAVDAQIRRSPELQHTRSLLVAHRGDLVLERSYGECGDDLHAIHSITKSVVSTLVGILVAEGLVTLDTPIGSLLPAPGLAADPAKAAVTVRHLLTMTSGLDGSGRWDLDEIAERGDPWVEAALEAPLVAAPGSSFAYSNGAAHVLSGVIEAVAGTRVADVAGERLFEPLGIDRWRWDADPQGRHDAAGGLRLAPRDLLKLGLLYLAGGRWDGSRIVDEAYVRAATSPATAGGPPERCPYGMLWWVPDGVSPPRYFAGGWGGQYVHVVPARELVVVTTGDAEAGPRALGLLLRRLATETIVPAFTRR